VIALVTISILAKANGYDYLLGCFKRNPSTMNTPGKPLSGKAYDRENSAGAFKALSNIS
jgi:hypothetical protein